ncbi:hypothetical protein N7524_011636 [Penicillium chrysogenum]|nr:hypothetical protein N7524_011636 [Penicillium chrysogenum]
MFIPWAAASAFEAVQFPIVKIPTSSHHPAPPDHRQLAPIDADGRFEDDRDVSPACVKEFVYRCRPGSGVCSGQCASPSAAVITSAANENSVGAFDLLPHLPASDSRTAVQRPRAIPPRYPTRDYHLPTWMRKAIFMASSFVLEFHEPGRH